MPITEEYLQNRIDFYDLLTAEERATLKRTCVYLSYKKSQVLMSPYSPCLGVYFVDKGRLRVSLYSEEGKEVNLYYVEEGEASFLTANCILTNIHFNVRIEVDEDCEGVLVPACIFQNLQDSNVKVENYALKAVAERFSDCMWAMQQLLFLPINKRIVIFLHDEYVRTSDLVIKTTHKQVAQALGSAREVVTRALVQLQKKNLIKIGRGEIEILDKKALFEEL